MACCIFMFIPTDMPLTCARYIPCHPGLQNDAEDFASMAAKLEAKMAERKWWQF